MQIEPVSMPKIDLHCHLDGSLSPAFIRNTLGMSTLEDSRLCAPKDCQSLAEYLTCFDLPVSCLQEKQHIREAIVDVVSQAAAENVRYLEIRFAPMLSVNSSLSLSSVVQEAVYGCQKAFDRFGVFTNLILCTMRHHTQEQNLHVLRCAREFLGAGVCAIDLAGDEAGHPNEEFEALFAEAKRIGMPFTIHSGECGRIRNVELALAYGARRVGHGIAAIQDSALMEACKEAHLGFELCPTSNFQTKASADTASYPLRRFLDYGLLATVNTDNRTVSHTTCTKELQFCLDSLELKKGDLRTLYKNSVEISFADDSLKDQLLYLI